MTSIFVPFGNSTWLYSHTVLSINIDASDVCSSGFNEDDKGANLRMLCFFR